MSLFRYTWKRYLLFFIAFLLLIVMMVLWFKMEDIRVELIGSAIWAVLEWVVIMIYRRDAYKHKEGFSIPVKFSKDSEIRVSFSYLIRIKFEDKYLLVKGKFGKYQPVGGVYHHNDRFLENTFNFIPDEHHADKNDIRGCIKLKVLDGFIDWFKSGKNRECNTIREFKEELIETNIIDRELFENPNFEYINYSYRGIKYSENTRKHELMRFDIYELILCDEQVDYLKSMNSKSNDYLIIDKDGIEKFGITKENPVNIIAEHTHYIL